MLVETKQQLQITIHQALQKAYPDASFSDVILEVPSDKTHGDLSTNIAMRSAKAFKKNPVQIAEEFVAVIDSSLKDSDFGPVIDKVEVRGPGFINFYLSNDSVFNVLEQIFKEKEAYGRAKVGKGQKIDIEFVSANPTGPLSVAHARQAAVGDCLGNILLFIGFDVTKEYYVNDGGNQINLLGQSLEYRCKEYLGASVENQEDFYQGDYLKDLAKEYCSVKKISSVDQLNVEDVREFAKDTILAIIRQELQDFGVTFDQWSFESKVADKKAIEKMLKYLTDKGLVYENEGARWFKTTAFGDDKDRVVQKSDGAYTYLTPDMVYHKNKFDREFDQVIDIMGPDHHGYIPRLKAAAQAMDKSADQIEVLIVQLATIYRDGKEVSMSTRKGEFISLREVIDEVGVDASRFFFLMRSIKQHLEFDLDLAKKETSENPVYYIQYAHARMNSVQAKAKDAKLKTKTKGFKLLNEEEELDLIKKLGAFQQVLLACHRQLDPYTLVQYMMEVASCFHRFYDKQRVMDESVAQDLAEERLGLMEASKIVFANGLKLLGCSAPESM